jgi:hypothetical protein
MFNKKKHTYVKQNGSTTVKGADGKIVGNIPSAKLSRTNVQVTVQPPTTPSNVRHEAFVTENGKGVIENLSADPERIKNVVLASATCTCGWFFGPAGGALVYTELELHMR